MKNPNRPTAGVKPAIVQRKLLEIAPLVFDDVRIRFAYLYGSYAVGQANAFSDVDIGIFISPMSDRERLDLELALSLEIDERLDMGLQSDVRTLNALPLAVVGNIVIEGILVHCSDDAARIEYESTVRCAYFDFLPFLRRYQRSYLSQVAKETEGSGV